MRVLLVDAYDSFTHIIYQYLRTLGAETVVVRSRTLTPDEMAAFAPDAVLLGPGPGHPAGSGHVELVHRFAGEVPILGVCLGHQAIGLAFGGVTAVASHLMHGKTSVVDHDGQGVFAGAPAPVTVTRYHSLILTHAMPPDLEVTAVARDDGYVMGVRHRTLDVEGVQFHPESIMTQDGTRLFGNFLRRAARRPAIAPAR
ncbi:anthranilate synthase component II [Cryptosporangium aurantiacum]|uniref:Anthranilate synthase, component II n=1 Tax=Cryptosporangium aurantiacum TaxID=134849 RepID=A0A1M7P985_9ACTN|nr:aminodeoxychorismate/anthranilate synthase component II [Cryptosporangium aurantiacum]SHN13315.1 anthranilate synthase, component II [Cryptosporangium aurantiacum]